MENHNVVCLDPSCFTSLNNLNDTLSVLYEFKETTGALTVCVPTEIHETILKEPREKFARLPNVLIHWFQTNELNVEDLNESQQNRYVAIMRTILSDFRVISTESIVGNVRKIGEHSILYDEVIRKLGEAVGITIFQMLATSFIHDGTIIAFGNRTSVLVRNAGVSIKEGYSEFKRVIKKKKGISGILKLMRLVMSPTVFNAIMAYYGMQQDANIANDLTNGLLIIADG